MEVTNPDGSKRWESTHLVIRDPNSRVAVSQETWDRFAAGNVPGFPAGMKLPQNGTELKLSTVQRANEILTAHSLVDNRLSEIRDTLAGTPFASKIPTSVDFSKPGVETALTRFQKYVSHSNMHGMDIFESLQTMGADKRDPRTGQMQPNSDAKYVETVADQFGGWPVLKALHDKLESDSAAQKTGAEESARIAADPLGQQEKAANITRTRVETARAAEELKQMKELGSLTDPFGVQVGKTASGQVMNRKELDAAQKVFNKDYVESLNVLQKTSMEFNRINSNPNQSGAERVTALLAAVGISGDPLKGKGFRISSPVIDEHAQSRNIWQGAVQKLNTIAGSGGPITSSQINDYTHVALGVVHDAYVTAAQEARRQGLPVDFLPKGQGQRIDPYTVKIYLDAAGGDRAAARNAAQAGGWKF